MLRAAASATASPATTRSGRSEPLRDLAADGQLTRLPPPRLLAGDGHAARAQRARGAVGVRRPRAVAARGRSRRRRSGRRACRFCGAPLEHVVRRPRHVADRQRQRPAGARRARWSRSTRCTRSSARAASSSSSRPFETAEAHLPRRLRLLLVVLDVVAGALPPLRRADDRAPRARTPSSQVVELASNDGYLLQYFEERGHPGARHRADGEHRRRRARARASRRAVEFFGERDRARGSPPSAQADLLLGNNVLAHVPDINDFVAGMKLAAEAGRRRSRSSSRTCSS